MAGINNGRELVQEAAELGISQIDGLVAPDFLRDLDANSVANGRFEGKNLEDLAKDENYCCIAEVGQQIIKYAKLPETNPLVKVFVKRSSSLRRARSDEAFAGQHHIDNYHIQDGFSLLCAIEPSSEEVLHTAGRARAALASRFYQKNYSKGAVLLAQGQFGAQILPKGSDVGLTWHTGVRNERGKLLIIDFSTASWPFLPDQDELCV